MSDELCPSSHLLSQRDIGLVPPSPLPAHLYRNVIPTLIIVGLALVVILMKLITLRYFIREMTALVRPRYTVLATQYSVTLMSTFDKIYNL